MQKTNFEYEIIVHDDASTDGTREILLEYQERFPDKIRLILEQENQYSKGKRVLPFIFPEVRGKYIAISDCDDEWIYDRKLQEQYDLMEGNSDISLCIHNAIRNNIQTGERINQIQGMETRALTDEEIILEKQGRCPTSSFFFRTEHISELPDFYHRAPVGDDPLRFYLACKGKIFYIDEVWAIRNFMREGSWNYKMLDSSFRLKFYKGYLSFLEEFNIYSRKRFEVYIQQRMDVFISIVGLMLPQNVTVDALNKVIRSIEDETKNHYTDTLAKVHQKFLNGCVDYLEEKVERFIVRCHQAGGKLFLYGAGDLAGKAAEVLKYRQISYEGFVVSDDGHRVQPVYKGDKVWTLSELSEESGKIFLWLCVNQDYIQQILPAVIASGHPFIY